MSEGKMRQIRPRSDSGRMLPVEVVRSEQILMNEIATLKPDEYDTLRDSSWLPEKIKQLSNPKEYQFMVGQMVRRIRVARFRDLRKMVRESQDVDPGAEAAKTFESIAQDYTENMEDFARIAELQYIRTRERKLRKELEHETVTSKFGDIANKKGVEAMFAKGEFTDKTIAVVRTDLDGFKAINDLYGHEAGDLALQAFVEALEEQTRTSDVPVHFSGDEYGVVIRIDESKMSTSEGNPETFIPNLIARVEAKAMTRFRELYEAAEFEKPLTHDLKMSTGFVIAPKGDKDFKTLSTEADHAVEVSKLLAQTGKDLRSNERVVPSGKHDEMFAKYGIEKSEVLKLSLKRHLKRGAEEYARLTDKEANDVLEGLVNCIMAK